MSFHKKIIFLFISGIFLSFNISYAQTIKYSLGPICKEGKVLCTDPKEIPVCLALEPRIHLQTINSEGENGEKVNRFQPSCAETLRGVTPGCIDISDGNKVINDGVILECVELIQCSRDEATNKLTAYCSGGKRPICLGSSDIPDCEKEIACDSGAIPICDYVQWAAVSDSSYQ